MHNESDTDRNYMLSLSTIGRKISKRIFNLQKNIEPPKTHNLDALCEMCYNCDECFQDIKRACNILTLYGIQPRYPKEIEIFDKDMKKALEYAKQIQNFKPLMLVRQKLEM